MNIRHRRVLRGLVQAGQAPAAVVADAIGMEPRDVAPILQVLQGRGLVERVAATAAHGAPIFSSPTRRACWWQLTAAGVHVAWRVLLRPSCVLCGCAAVHHEHGSWLAGAACQACPDCDAYVPEDTLSAHMAAAGQAIAHRWLGRVA